MSSGNFDPNDNSGHDSIDLDPELVTGLPQDLDPFFDEFLTHLARRLVDHDATVVDDIDELGSAEDIDHDIAREVVAHYLKNYFGEEDFDSASDFDAPYTASTVVGAGGAGCRLGTSTAATRNKQDVLHAGRNPVNGEFNFDHNGLFETVDVQMIDTEQIRSQLKSLMGPDDDAQFGQCLLDAFWPVREGGAGRNPRRFVQWLFLNPDILSWVIKGLQNSGFSIEKIIAGLGGGTGSGLVAATLELAKMDIIGTGSGMFGYSVVTNGYGESEDIYALTDDTDRTVLEDIHDNLYRLADALDNGVVDYVIYTPNTWLGLHRYISGEHLSYERIKNLLEPLREHGNPIPIAERCQTSRVEAYTGFPEVNDEFRHLEFAVDLLFQRPERAKFSRGIVGHDVTDMAGVIQGHMWARSTDGVEEFQALNGLDDNCRKVTGSREALYVTARRSAAKLAADVPYDDIYKAYSIVYAPEFDVSRSDLRLVERTVATEFGLGGSEETVAVSADVSSEPNDVSSDGGQDPLSDSLAVELDGMGSRVPGNDKLRIWTFAAHEIPTEVLQTIRSREFQEVVR